MDADQLRIALSIISGRRIDNADDPITPDDLAALGMDVAEVGSGPEFWLPLMELCEGIVLEALTGVSSEVAPEEPAAE